MTHASGNGHGSGTDPAHQVRPEGSQRDGPRQTVSALQRAALDGVGQDDIRAIVSKLVELARAGDVPAALGLMGGLLDSASAGALVKRVERLERLLSVVEDDSSE